MNYPTLKKKAFLTVLIAIPLFFTSCTDLEKNVQNGSGVSEASVASSSASNTADQQDLIDAPDFTLAKMDGEPFTLSEHEGKVVVLNIWATWCPPCRKEIPDFVEIQEEMRDDGLLFVGVSLDKTGWNVVRPFAEQYNINYPLVVDDGTVSRKYGPFRGIPTTFIINRKGKVEYVAPGMISKEIIQPVLEKLANR